MRRLLLPTLLGVFCLTLLALPARAGHYDPRNPPPTPYIDINDGLNNADIGWTGPAQSAEGDQNLDQPTANPSENVAVLNLEKAGEQGQTGNVIRRVMLSVLVPIIFGW